MPLYRRQVIKPTADLDAVAYIGKVGITDVVAQNAINDFVLGIKALNYYSSMVVWLLRSSQNKGTGTIAYSLGGLGTFDGTLTNGPTWGTDGIVFDGVNDCITTSCVAANGPASFGFVSKVATPFTNDNIVYSLDDISNRKMGMYYTTAASSRIRYEANLNGSIGNRIDINGTNTGNFICAQASHDGTNFYAQGNSSTIQSVAGSGTMQGTGAPLVFGRRSANIAPGFFNGTLSFAYFCSTSIHSNFTNFYNLYKNTLGQGLGLP